MKSRASRGCARGMPSATAISNACFRIPPQMVNGAEGESLRTAFRSSRPWRSSLPKLPSGPDPAFQRYQMMLVSGLRSSFGCRPFPLAPEERKIVQSRMNSPNVEVLKELSSPRLLMGCTIAASSFFAPSFVYLVDAPERPFSPVSVFPPLRDPKPVYATQTSFLVPFPHSKSPECVHGVNFRR